MTRIGPTALLPILFVFDCQAPIDPDRGRFACERAADCGAGYVCVPQASGVPSALCYPEGACTAEECDGKDNDCDGIFDEDFDLSSDPGHCGSCGVSCPTGTDCALGACVEAACANTLDDDGDGTDDCQDPDCLGRPCSAPDGGPGNCGLIPDAGTSDAGEDAGTLAANQRLCVELERRCDNAADDDGDGQADCLDPDCEGQPCAPGLACADRKCL